MKILICGSAGFLMSNFIRYLFYRTKDYKIIGVDWLIYQNDYNKLYVHRDNKFFLGNIEDLEFVNKLIDIEKPNCIVNGVRPISNLSIDTIVKGSLNLANSNIPMIQIFPSFKHFDNNGILSSACKIIKNFNGLALELPNCFGIRQRKFESIPSIINSMNNGVYTYSSVKLPFVYAEDVASIIWFLIENVIKNQQVRHIRMPISGNISNYEIASIIKEQFSLNMNLIKDDKVPENVCLKFDSDRIEGWVQDNNNIHDNVLKTVKWYHSNKWALS